MTRNERVRNEQMAYARGRRDQSIMDFEAVAAKTIRGNDISMREQILNFGIMMCITALSTVSPKESE